MKTNMLRVLALLGATALVVTGCAADGGGTSSSTTGTTAPAETAEVEEEAGDADYWTMLEYFDFKPEEKDKLDALRAIAAADAVPISVPVEKRIKIAFVYPSFNLSEGWARGALAFERRLQELNIPHKIDEYGSTDQDHQRQASHVDAIIAAGDYDFVLYGPTEIAVQKAQTERMLAAGLPVMIWNYTTPLKDWEGEENLLSYIGFDHAEGAEMLCAWTLERTGGVGEFAVMRFIPGFIDDQRNGIFVDCVERGGMKNVYDHFSDGDNEKAYQGTQSTLTAYPDIVMIHAGNTAAALGAVTAARERGVAQSLIINGWGGGQSELDAILEGGLNVTPLRLQDDFGVFPAEMIKMFLEGKRAQIPLIGAGEYSLVDDTFTKAQQDAATTYAYRYSKTLER
jgi:autoinducer 2-binding protein LuxP